MTQSGDIATPSSREERHRLLNELVAMPMAATLAHIQTTDAIRGRVTESQMDAMAAELARLLTLYAISDSRDSITALGPDDTQGGRFKSAGKEVEFFDGRTITGLAVTRTSLNAAIDALRRSKAAKG
jgi:hypothetical protein